MTEPQPEGEAGDNFNDGAAAGGARAGDAMSDDDVTQCPDDQQVGQGRCGKVCMCGDNPLLVTPLRVINILSVLSGGVG